MLRLIDITETLNNEDKELMLKTAIMTRAIARHIEDSDNLFEDLNYLLSKSTSEEDFVTITKELIGITLLDEDFVINNLAIFISEHAYQRILKEYNLYFLTKNS